MRLSKDQRFKLRLMFAYFKPGMKRRLRKAIKNLIVMYVMAFIFQGWLNRLGYDNEKIVIVPLILCFLYWAVSVFYHVFVQSADSVALEDEDYWRNKNK